MSNLYLANDNYYAEITQEYENGDAILYVTDVPTNVPTILTVARGTANEVVLSVTGKTINSLTGVTRLRGSIENQLALTPVSCLNNEEFINQWKTYLGIDWKGAWDNAVTYALQDGVSYSGTSYVAIQAGTNHLPTDAAYWQVVGVKGDTGSQGVAGNDGLGVPAGGTTGQALVKKSNADNDTEWAVAATPISILQIQIFS